MGDEVEAASVFINYRRNDADGTPLPHVLAVEFLARHLAAFLGDDAVALDTTLPPGERYADTLRSRLDAAVVVLVVIHPSWQADLAARRGTHKDWVRTEIADAARAGKKLIPVLVDGAAPPAHADLDADLRPLADAQAVPLRFGALADGLDALTTEIALHVARRETQAAARVEPLPDRARLTTALVLGAIGVLAGVLLPFADTLPATVGLSGSGPAIALFALFPGFFLLIALALAALRHGLRRPALWLDELLHRITDHRPFALFGLGVVVVTLANLVLAAVAAAGLPVEAVMAVLVVSVLILAGMGIAWARAQAERPTWPADRVRPTSAWVLGELAHLERRLRGEDADWRAPLPLRSRRTADRVLTRISTVCAALTEEHQAGRRAWLRTRDPFAVTAVAALTAAAVLLLAAALTTHVAQGGTAESVVLYLAGMASAAASAAGITELAYRTDRWVKRETVTRALPRVEAARARLAELESTRLRASCNRAATGMR
ncbi:TIR domain-containing protein [Actinokineospora guangxiensis]|uniref:TIR domain-containing protein n=1 Tax=Actinokineospora guangxiensis TaxID=1490288 RepID=A0ABW0EV88_9PSEU